MKSFAENRQYLAKEYKNIEWIQNSGISPEALWEETLKLEDKLVGKSPAVKRAKIFYMILSSAQIAVDKHDVFQDKLNHGNVMRKLRDKWINNTYDEKLLEIRNKVSDDQSCGAYNAIADFGHVCPGWSDLLSLGIGGLRKRLKHLSLDDGNGFREAGETVLNALSLWSQRLAQAAMPYDLECAEQLNWISENPPRTLAEAMQLIFLYFSAYELIGGGRARTLGRLDILLRPFVETEPEENVRELLRFFLYKFAAADIPYDQPFELGGIREDGSESTCFLSYLIVEEYSKLSIHSPKIHIRVSENTPEDFLRAVLKSIRSGSSSFVFCNDAVAVKALTQIGISEKDAREYVLIGCYEPVARNELCTTGNGSVNLAKAIELTFTRGYDFGSGRLITCDTGELSSHISFEQFYNAVCMHIEKLADSALDAIRSYEKVYPLVNPDPLLSVTYPVCVEHGIDVYSGGTRYNNSSLTCFGIATLIDALCAVRHFVFDTKEISLKKLGDILSANWKDYENMRLKALNLSQKYGNGNTEADYITKKITEFISSCITGKPNGRGGIFKAGLFSIDHFIPYGKKTAATPDGRRSGEPVSKNLCASVGRDKNGITALVRSVKSIDHAAFSNGSVLDVVYHPSAVSGEEGIDAMLAVFKTYFAGGGFAMHGNVFSTDVLRLAQKNPEQYSTLQVRVCGWNVYFVNLSRKEQDDFIVRAAHAEQS